MTKQIQDNSMQQLNERFDFLEQLFKQQEINLEQRLEKQEKNLEQRLEKQEKNLEQRLEKQEKNLEQRLDQIEQQLDQQVENIRNLETDKVWQNLYLNAAQQPSLGPSYGPTHSGLVDTPARWKRERPYRR